MPGSRDSVIPSVTVGERAEEHFHVLLWQAHGHSTVMIGDREYLLTDDSALWVPANTRHHLTVEADSVTAPLFFDSRTVSTTMGQPALISVCDDLKVLMLAHSVSWGTVIKPQTDLPRRILSRIEHMSRGDGDLPLPSRDPAKSIADALRSNPGDVRSAEDLAASVHASRRTVERIFKSETGLTLRDWRIRNRMEAAAGLLNSANSVNSVAHRLGYTNPNSFRRVFAEHHGLTPLRYVKRAAERQREGAGAGV